MKRIFSSGKVSIINILNEVSFQWGKQNCDHFSDGNDTFQLSEKWSGKRLEDSEKCSK